jgi:predicted site-specific integrase-resolvase
MDKERVLYARVSTKTQLLDLDTQIDFLGKTYPGCRVVKDVASGMNWKRKNFLKLMTQVAQNQISEDVANQVHETQSKESVNRYENRYFRD